LEEDSTCSLGDPTVNCEISGSSEYQIIGIDQFSSTLYFTVLSTDSFYFPPPRINYYRPYQQDLDTDQVNDIDELLKSEDPRIATDFDSDGFTLTDTYPLDANYSGDSDLDGIDDVYESNYSLGVPDPTADNDGDGLDVRAEYAGGTSDLIANKIQQIIATSPGLRPLTASRIRFTYEVSDSRNDLTGMGLRIHFHEKDFSLFNIEVNTPYEAGLFEINNAWSFDEKNYDGDFHTNRYVSIEWTNQDGPWPGTPLPLEAFSVIAAPKPFYAFSEEAIVNFSAFSLAPGYGLLAPRLQLIKRLSAMLDIDADGEIKALTDGLIVLRWLFGYSDVTAGTLSFDSPYYDFPSDLLPALQSQEDLFDVDGDGQTSAFTDGVLLLRYLFGYRGDALISGAIGANATRKTATDIENRLNVMSEL